MEGHSNREQQAVWGALVENVPEELKSSLQWVLWRLETRDGKPTKVPYQTTGWKAKSDDPTTWATFNAVLDVYIKEGGRFSGIGFVLSEDDPFAGVDLDHCLDPETSLIVPWALEIIHELDSYTEITPSGQGIRIFARGKLPPGGRKRGNIEVYDSGRFLTVTGRHLEGTPVGVLDRNDRLKALHASVFPGNGRPKTPSPSPPSGSCIPEDDDLVERARTSQNGEKLSRLLAGDWEGYASQSEADLALCCLLAFWSQDPQQIDRIFRSSGLYREKWDRKHFGDGRAYGGATIEAALNTVRERYTPGKRLMAMAALGRITRRADGRRVLEVKKTKRPVSAKEVLPWRG